MTTAPDATATATVTATATATGPAPADRALSQAGRPATTAVRLEGRLDAASVAVARELLSRATDVGSGDVVLDCSGVECVDVTGLGLLTSMHRRLRSQNRRLVLVDCRPQVRRALAVTRLSRILPVQTSAPARAAATPSTQPVQALPTQSFAADS